jgi:hypothetical protein
VDVEIVSVPKPVIFEAGTQVCEGEILFLGAAEVPGATFTWIGPNGFIANARNTQILNSTPANSGEFIVQMSLNNCSNRSDTVSAIVFPSPVINIIGDSIQIPGSTSLFHVNGQSGITYFWIFDGNNSLINNTIFTSDKDSVVIFWKNAEGVLSIQVIGEDENGCQSKPDILNILVTNSEGINSTIEKEINVYPNPAKDALFVNLSNGNYTILDALGKNVISGRIPSDASKINIDSLKNGIYFIQLNNSKGNYWKKFVVDK